MPMNPNFLCCIGAELKNSTQQTTRMTQVYLYRAFESETIADMLSTGFFNQALGIIRQDDLLLLYSPNETNPRWVYARVSSATRDGIEISKVDVQAQDILVDTTGYSNLAGDNLQEILNNLDTTITTINDTFVRKDGTSIMSAPLKFVAGSLRGGIGPTFGGVEFYTLNNDSPTYSLVPLGRFSTNGFLPHNDNTYDIGSTARYWKDAYIARVITAVINNGYDIAVPATVQPETFALKSQVDDAANSGEQLYTTGVWYAKMYSASTVPTGSEYEGRNYADFSQVDGNNDPIIVVYTYTSGAWTQTAIINPPKNHNGYMTITSKIWDIAEQAGQQGGLVLWSHNQGTFTPYPYIISFKDADLTGTPTAPNLSVSSPNNQIVNKQSLEDALQNHGTGRNVGDVFLTMRTDNGLNGAVECNGGTYDTTDFTGAESIGNLLNAGKVPFVSLATYASTVAAKGWCDKIGWDGIGTTTFRVPTLTPHIVETNNIAIIGNGISLGLTDGTQELGLGYYASNSYYTGAAKNNSGQTVGSTFDGIGTTLSNKILGVSTDSTKSGIVGDVSDEWQPRVMIQLMVSATDEAVATCTAVTAQVAANTSAIAGADYVVETQLPTAENNYTWYRKYKSGWVEQGGRYLSSVNNGSQFTVNLPVEMAAGNMYNVCCSGTTFSSVITAVGRNPTVLTLQYSNNQTNIAGSDFSWEVKGMSAN